MLVLRQSQGNGFIIENNFTGERIRLTVADVCGKNVDMTFESIDHNDEVIEGKNHAFHVSRFKGKRHAVRSS